MVDVLIKFLDWVLLAAAFCILLIFIVRRNNRDAATDDSLMPALLKSKWRFVSLAFNLFFILSALPWDAVGLVILIVQVAVIAKFLVQDLRMR